MLPNEHKTLVVVKKGEKLNSTLASLKYDRNGATNSVEIIVCDTWRQGFISAKHSGHKTALFVNSGTVFLDWNTWAQKLKKYPNKGLIAHILFGPEDRIPRIHEQAFYIQCDLFPESLIDYYPTDVCSVKSSDQHVHDDYTPMWITPDCDTHCEITVKDFLQQLVCFQLNENKQTIVNWHNTLREHKIFLYKTQNNSEWNQYKADYETLAESQLWILNNEKLPVHQAHGKLLTPGSGLFWIFCALNKRVTSIKIVDISIVQYDFCKELWNTWDGNNYGDFVVAFLKRRNIIHFQLDNPGLTHIDKLKMLGKKQLSQYINQRFLEHCDEFQIENFQQLWKNCKTKVEFENESILQQQLDEFDSVWCSNILEYKWTLLAHEQSVLDNFILTIGNRQIK